MFLTLIIARFRLIFSGKSIIRTIVTGAAERSKKWGGGGRRLGIGMNGGGGGVFDKEFQSAPVNCKADRLSAFCTSRTQTSAIRTRHDKTMLLVTKGGNGHFRTLQAITYKKILNNNICVNRLITSNIKIKSQNSIKYPTRTFSIIEARHNQARRKQFRVGPAII